MENLNIIIISLLVIGTILSLIVVTKMRKKTGRGKQLNDRDERIQKHYEKMQKLKQENQQ